MVDSYIRLFNAHAVYADVCGPNRETVKAKYCVLPDGSAVIETASCAGLPLTNGRNDILTATTFGVGQLIMDAADHGIKRILLGLGGSATNDCGMGMAAALGFRFFDAKGAEVRPIAKNMAVVRSVTAPDALPDVTVTAACDVDSPLYGKTGAAYTFGPQKGADARTVALLDDGLKNMADVLKRGRGGRTWRRCRGVS